MTSSCFRSPSNAVRKIRSPQKTGDEWPAGTVVFHSMFFPGPNSIGGALAVAAIPVALGPRNCGQPAATVSFACVTSARLGAGVRAAHAP